LVTSGTIWLLQVQLRYFRYGKARDADVEPAVVVDDKKLIQEMKMTERLQFTSYGTWDNGKVSHIPYWFFFFVEISGFGPIGFLRSGSGCITFDASEFEDPNLVGTKMFLEKPEHRTIASSVENSTCG
jgi:hypothetical protein